MVEESTKRGFWTPHRQWVIEVQGKFSDEEGGLYGVVADGSSLSFGVVTALVAWRFTGICLSV